MNLKKRERAVRDILAALLGSDLSVVEMQELMQDIVLDPAFFASLATLINESGISRRDWDERKLVGSREGPSKRPSILTEIQRQRLSKREFLELADKFMPGFSARDSSTRGTLRELVSSFTREASANQVAELQQLLSFDKGGDPYLRGIRDRK